MSNTNHDKKLRVERHRPKHVFSLDEKKSVIAIEKTPVSLSQPSSI